MNTIASIQEFCNNLIMNGLKCPISITLDKDSYYKFLSELQSMTRLYTTKDENDYYSNEMIINLTGGQVKIFKGN